MSRIKKFCVILCGYLGISFRGHHDDSKYYPEAGQHSETSVGNFIEIINFAIRRGDTILKNHYIKHKKNASYLSKETQNDLIEKCGAGDWKSVLSKCWCVCCGRDGDLRLVETEQRAANTVPC